MQDDTPFYASDRSDASSEVPGTVSLWIKLAVVLLVMVAVGVVLAVWVYRQGG